MKMKKRENIIDGLNYKGHYLITTYKKLKEILGDPTYSHSVVGRSNVIWDFYTDDDKPFSIYNLHPIEKVGEDQIFRISGGNYMDSLDGLEEIEKALDININT